MASNVLDTLDAADKAELEKSVLYLEQLLDKQRAEDLVRLAKDLAAIPPPQLVDVRTATEFRGGRIPGAISAPILPSLIAAAARWWLIRASWSWAVREM